MLRKSKATPTCPTAAPAGVRQSNSSGEVENYGSYGNKRRVKRSEVHQEVNKKAEEKKTLIRGYT